MAHTHDVPATSFIPAASVPAAADAPWAAQNNVPIVASQTTALPAGGSGNIYETSYFTGVPPSQLAAVHHVETSSFAQQVPRQQRPLQDIVSSMQGSFHFLQESQIDLDSE
jgi:hypothetical protein